MSDERDFVGVMRRLTHAAVIDIDRTRLLPATHHFNPTLAFHDGALWMAYRRISPDEWLGGPRTIAMCRLGSDLQPEAGSNIDLSEAIDDPPGSLRWHADPRLFRRADDLWLSYHDNFTLHLTPLGPLLSESRLQPCRVELVDRPRRERERNWGFFDDGVLKAVYAIPSHSILEVSRADDVFRGRTIAETPVRLPWDSARYGEPHGGCMPVRVGAHWCAFFQSASWDSVAERRHYHVGFYGFEADMPHRIAFMTPAPILSADRFPDGRSFYKDWAVVYPAGAVQIESRWLVSLGIHDTRPALAVFDHTELLSAAVPL